MAFDFQSDNLSHAAFLEPCYLHQYPGEECTALSFKRVSNLIVLICCMKLIFEATYWRRQRTTKGLQEPHRAAIEDCRIALSLELKMHDLLIALSQPESQNNTLPSARPTIEETAPCAQSATSPALTACAPS